MASWVPWSVMYVLPLRVLLIDTLIGLRLQETALVIIDRRRQQFNRWSLFALVVIIFWRLSNLILKTGITFLFPLFEVLWYRRRIWKSVPDGMRINGRGSSIIRGRNMGLLSGSSGRIDAAVFLLPYAIGEIASRRVNSIGWDIGHQFLLGGGSHGLTVIALYAILLFCLHVADRKSQRTDNCPLQQQKQNATFKRKHNKRWIF